MSTTPVDVVVTGPGATTPLGGAVAALWYVVLDGRSGVRRIHDVVAAYAFADDLPTKIAAPMPASPADALTRVQARRMDRAEQAAFVAAREAWQHAGTPEVDPERLAVAMGTGIGGVT